MKNNFYKSLIWMMDNDDECMGVKKSIFEKNVDEFFSVTAISCRL